MIISQPLAGSSRAAVRGRSVPAVQATLKQHGNLQLILATSQTVTTSFPGEPIPASSPDIPPSTQGALPFSQQGLFSC